MEAAAKSISLARKHIGNGSAMESSALVCLADAIQNFVDGKFEAARDRAKMSLAYSVGCFHADYRAA